MNMSGIPDWIMAICAVLSLVGAVISWWRAKLSNKARKRAQVQQEAATRAAETAQCHARAAVAQAKAAKEQAEIGKKQSEDIAALVAEVRSIREQGEKPRLEIFWNGSRHFNLRNTSKSSFVCTGIANADKFLKPPFNTPLTLKPGDFTEGVFLTAHGRAGADALVLEERNAPNLVVRFPPRPSS